MFHPLMAVLVNSFAQDFFELASLVAASCLQAESHHVLYRSAILLESVSVDVPRSMALVPDILEVADTQMTVRKSRADSLDGCAFAVGAEHARGKIDPQLGGVPLQWVSFPTFFGFPGRDTLFVESEPVPYLQSEVMALD